jgi:hypothetical protein
MAAVTFTSTDGIAANVKLNQNGVTVATSHYVKAQTSTLSVSDEVLMMKIPNHVTILDAYLVADTKSTVSGTFKLGVAGTDDNIMTALSASDGGVLLRANAVTLPLVVSLTDSTENAWTWLKMTCAAKPTTASASYSFALTVLYARTGVAE